MRFYIILSQSIHNYENTENVILYYSAQICTVPHPKYQHWFTMFTGGQTSLESRGELREYDVTSCPLSSCTSLRAVMMIMFEGIHITACCSKCSVMNELPA